MNLPSTEAVSGTIAWIGVNWEMYTVATRRAGDTFSAKWRKMGRLQHVIPFFCGLLNFHLWADDEGTLEAYNDGWANGKHWPCIDKEDDAPVVPEPAPVRRSYRGWVLMLFVVVSAFIAWRRTPKLVSPRSR